MDKQIVAYFDFDGTLTRCDTLLPFLKHVLGPLKFYLKLILLLPVLIMYLLKIINNERAKEFTLTVMIKGLPYNLIENKAKDFAKSKLIKYLLPNVYMRLEYHIEQGHSIILVSANLAIYLRYFAKHHYINEVIGTEIEFINGKCSGKLSTKNCFGAEKTSRIIKYLMDNKLMFAYSYGYGNSRGDYELLHYVNEPYWVTKDGQIRAFEI